MNQRLLNQGQTMRAVVKWLFITMAFALSRTQNLLYTSNQNTKFLHGLADAGFGFLKEDWIAKTIDPLPVFSFLIRLTYSFLHENFFYIYFVLFLGIYIFSMIGICATLFKGKNLEIKSFILFALILIVHSRAFFNVLGKLFGHLFFLNFLIAQQYLLGFFFQNSIFGVLLLLSIYLFLRNKPFLAALCISICCIFHSVYLLAGALLTISYMVIILKEERNPIKAILPGLLTLVLVLPILWYSCTYLGPSSPESWQEALRITVNIRIPHHSLPQVWMGPSVYIQVLLVMIALYIVRRTRLFIIILLPFVTAIVLTIIQILTDSLFLAMLAPWRLSVFLVPLSFFILLTSIISYLFHKFEQPILKNLRIFRVTGLVVIVLCVISGIAIQVRDYYFYKNMSSLPVMDFINETKKSGDVFLIPPKYGDLVDFKLYTGAPVFITWKSHPYKDTEVIEWYRRYLIAKEFYESSGRESLVILKDLSANYGINYVVSKTAESHPEYEGMKKIYSDSNYAVFRIHDN